MWSVLVLTAIVLAAALYGTLVLILNVSLSKCPTRCNAAAGRSMALSAGRLHLSDKDKSPMFGLTLSAAEHEAGESALNDGSFYGRRRET